MKIWDSHTGALLQVLRAHTDRVNTVCWSRNGELLISGGGDSVIRCWRPNEEQSARAVAGKKCCAWSPDGRYLATSKTNRPSGVLVLDTTTWQTSFVLAVPEVEPWHSAHSLSWSQDGRKLAAVLGDSFVQAWDMANLKEIWSWQGPEGVVCSVAWSPDSRRLAIAGQLVRICQAESGKLLMTFNGHTEAVTSAVWHPDGRRIASQDREGKLLIWDASTGETLRELDSRGHNGLAWNPAGTFLASGCWNGSIRIWDVSSGRLLRELKRHNAPVKFLCWSPDGHRLVSGGGDQTIRVWEVETDQELFSFRDPRIWMPVVSWSPSGRMIAVCGDENWIYDASIGYELASPRQ